MKNIMENLKKELDVKYMDLGEYYFRDDKIDENYDTKTEVAKIRKSAVEFKIKKNEKFYKEGGDNNNKWLIYVLKK